MTAFLTRHGFKVAVPKADAVAPNKREAWVAKQVAQGVDVLICHPRLVQTVLDLIEFPTICWFETDYSVYTMRQASRRSWRIGQTQQVKVEFMAYRHTLQADALKLVAQKLQSSLAVEGALPDDGLAAYGDQGDDLMLALARKLVSGDEDPESVESVFDQAQRVATQAEALLVDDSWQRAEPEPIPQLVSLPSGTRPGTGYCAGSEWKRPRETRNTADPVQLGRVHGQRAGAAQTEGAQYETTRPFTVRVGARTRAAGGPGRCGRLEERGGRHTTGVAASRWSICDRFCRARNRRAVQSTKGCRRPDMILASCEALAPTLMT